jgi:prolyl oligopeptidase
MTRTLLPYAALTLVLLWGCASAPAPRPPQAPKKADLYVLHGTPVEDPYLWLEKGDDPAVKAWTAGQEQATRAFLDPLPQRDWLKMRFAKLWRYDDTRPPVPVLKGDRVFFWTKKASDEHWVYWTREREGAEAVMLIDPNAWGPHDTLDLTEESPDGSLVAFGRAQKGDENPIIRVMETATKRILPDTLRGWRQGGVSWLHDNSGFYYACQPLKGEVPEGEENYWYSVWFHKLGTPASADVKVFADDKVKEYWHAAGVAEDGEHVLFYKGMYYKNDLYLSRAGSAEPPKPIVTGMEAQYSADLADGRLFIWTDRDAPLGTVWTAPADDPARANWRPLIPETGDKLEGFQLIGGRLYAHYLRNASTLIRVFDLDGKFLRDLPLPGIGSASINGYFSKPEVRLGFSSFTTPSHTYRYDFDRDALTLIHRTPIDLDTSGNTVEQVWYDSRDGTRVSMFLVRRKDLVRDGGVPVLLTGYGGFDVSLTPSFSTAYAVWLEAGGMVAIPNLRGGGEYGKAWHEAGMLGRKQNVFDDFIAAAEWLIANGYTIPKRLAISGGSNGGLLVGAALVQRPDLFRAVACGVPLLDMLRYHKYGYANVWAEEYGSADDPKAFEWLRAYSPYHNVKDGVKYPATLIVGSEDDARVDPLHARKMAARLQEADAGGGPILLSVRSASGHGGGTTITTQIEQESDEWAFLMDALGMSAPR